MSKAGTHVRTLVPVVIWETPRGNHIMPLQTEGTSWRSPASFAQLLEGSCLGVFPAGMAMRRDETGPFEDDEDVVVRWRRPRESDSYAVVPGFVVEAFTPPPPPPNMDRVRGFLDLIHGRDDLNPQQLIDKCISTIMEDGQLPEAEARVFYAEWLKSRS